MEGLWAAGRSIALEMLLLQMAPEGLSRAERFSCAKLRCGEQLCSHCSISAGVRPSRDAGWWEQAPERCSGKLTGPCQKRNPLPFHDAPSHLDLHHFCIIFFKAACVLPGSWPALVPQVRLGCSTGHRELRGPIPGTVLEIEVMP